VGVTLTQGCDASLTQQAPDLTVVAGGLGEDVRTTSERASEDAGTAVVDGEPSSARRRPPTTTRADRFERVRADREPPAC
jgi:hypothetical protein